jgi:beta-galactosidase
MVQPTTYDYDAPLSEAGDVTPKFMAIREAVSRYLPLPDIPVPTNSTKVGYGKVQMTYVSFLLIKIQSEIEIK